MKKPTPEQLASALRGLDTTCYLQRELTFAGTTREVICAQDGMPLTGPELDVLLECIVNTRKIPDHVKVRRVPYAPQNSKGPSGD